VHASNLSRRSALHLRVSSEIARSVRLATRKADEGSRDRNWCRVWPDNGAGTVETDASLTAGVSASGLVYDRGVGGDSSAEGVAPRPLQRFTLEEDDPAEAWLSVVDRARAGVWELVPIGVAILVFVGGPLVWGAAKHQSTGNLASDVRGLLVGAQLAFWGLFSTFRWFGLQLKDRAVRRLALRRASIEAREVDDWSALDGQPDGQLVSVVGWVSARRSLDHLIDGRRCVGLVFDCQATRTEMRDDDRTRNFLSKRVPYRQPHEAIVEVSEDFDLVDEAGRTLPVQVAGARLLGWRNVDRLGDDADEQRFLASLRLAIDVVPIGNDVFAVRDGDPVLVIGFTAPLVDSRVVSHRGPALRTSLASLPPRPLLVCPLHADPRPKGRPPGNG
jgi:hypothetical protein